MERAIAWKSQQGETVVMKSIMYHLSSLKHNFVESLQWSNGGTVLKGGDLLVEPLRRSESSACRSLKEVVDPPSMPT